METALDAIPGPCRDVVRLRLFEDLSFDEVALALRISATTAARRFREGIETYYRVLTCSLGLDPPGDSS